jgi:hypothetical protein
MFSLVRAIYNYVIDDSQGRLLSGYNLVKLSCNTYNHRLKMELDLQSLFHVHSCSSLAETPHTHPPAFGLIYEGASGQPRQKTSLYDPMLIIFASNNQFLSFFTYNRE